MVSPDFQGFESYPLGSQMDISANGIIVGGVGYMNKNWIWTNGVYSTVADVPGPIGSISDDGSIMVAGGGYMPLGNPLYKIVNGATQIIPGFAQDTWTYVNSISGNGSKIVGGTRSGVAWVYENDSYAILPITVDSYAASAKAISNDGSIIAGYIALPNIPNAAVLWRNGSIEILSNPENLAGWMPNNISGDGSTVVGTYRIINGYLACRWNNGVAETLPILEGFTRAEAVAASFDGSLVYGNASGNARSAFVWDEVDGTRLLKDFLEDDYGLDLTGWNLLSVSATDAFGNIITGYGINPQGEGELWIATIPEPTTILFLSFGGLLLRKRK